MYRLLLLTALLLAVLPLSAGRDRLFGIGGQYLSTGNVKLPYVFVDPANPATANYTPDSLQTKNANEQASNGQMLSSDIRGREKDNITNFSPGKLD